MLETLGYFAYGFAIGAIAVAGGYMLSTWRGVDHAFNPAPSTKPTMKQLITRYEQHTAVENGFAPRDILLSTNVDLQQWNKWAAQHYRRILEDEYFYTF